MCNFGLPPAKTPAPTMKSENATCIWTAKKAPADNPDTEVPFLSTLYDFNASALGVAAFANALSPTSRRRGRLLRRMTKLFVHAALAFLKGFQQLSDMSFFSNFKRLSHTNWNIEKDSQREENKCTRESNERQCCSSVA